MHKTMNLAILLLTVLFTAPVGSTIIQNINNPLQKYCMLIL